MRIGVDLGGTNVRVGLVAGGRIVRMISEPCRADGSEAEVLDHIASLVDRLITPDVECIGIGVPSVVDAERGIVYDVVGIPSWREVHLKERFEKRFGVPVSVNNDCNCFALGVCRFGEAHGYRDVVCIALGTGVGAGVVIGGKLYCGRTRAPGRSGASPIWTAITNTIAAAAFSSAAARRARRLMNGPWPAIPGRWSCGRSSERISGSWSCWRSMPTIRRPSSSEGVSPMRSGFSATPCTNS